LIANDFNGATASHSRTALAGLGIPPDVATLT
jgi:hypothetical protein